MRVLYITPSLRAGGAERQASILLPGLRRRGVDARALALDSGGPFLKPLREAGVPVEVLNMRHQLDLGRVLRSRIVRDFAPEMIISRAPSGAYVGHVLALWRGAVHVHNDHCPVGAQPSRRRDAMLRLIARRLSSIIVVSDDQRAGWLKYGCVPERVHVIANGVRAPATLDGRATMRRDLSIPDSAVVALIVASLRPEKRVRDFVRGLKRARETCSELIGVIVGDGVESALVKEAAAGDPAIRFLGQREDVPRLLQAADILVLTSAHEAQPMAILEGMAAGLPVLATNVGGIPQLVADGESGLLVPPADTDALADALLRLATHCELRITMGSAGRSRCERHWSADKMIDAYLDVLKGLLATAGGRPRAACRGSRDDSTASDPPAPEHLTRYGGS
jgi:glycosyltransferase involved in cell wall biosynthesis